MGLGRPAYGSVTKFRCPVKKHLANTDSVRNTRMETAQRGLHNGGGRETLTGFGGKAPRLHAGQAAIRGACPALATSRGSDAALTGIFGDYRGPFFYESGPF